MAAREHRTSGFAHLPAALSRREEEALRPLVESVPAPANGRTFSWRPLMDASLESWALLLDPTLIAIAELALGRPVFGVMLDANRAAGPSDAHSDAQLYDLAGVRFNLYPKRIPAGQGSLTIYPQTHLRAVWDEVKAEPDRLRHRPAYSADAGEGDVLAMDLRVWHEVASIDCERAFMSAFFYGVPRTEAEVKAVTVSAGRNRKALRIFGIEQEPYSEAVIGRLPKIWAQQLAVHGFTSAAAA
jgi:hypothetical protein